MIEHDFGKNCKLGKDKNGNFKYQIFYGKHFISLKYSLEFVTVTVFNILPGLRHRIDQIYHLWKKSLDGPLIILRSIETLKSTNNNKKFRSFKSKENIHKKGRRWTIPRFQL